MATNIQLKTQLNYPSEAALALPFFNLLPKDKISLLKWRVYVLVRCLDDNDFRNDIEAMCARDIAFFAATFAWLHETRDDAFTESAGTFPLVLWCDQVDILAWLQQYGGKFDICIEKTRGIGLSWLVIIYLFWKWRYYGEHLDYGILSKDDKSLDLHRRPATLMGKLDLLFESMPGWMQLGPDSKTVLNRTEWRAKEPRSCGVTQMHSHPPSARRHKQASSLIDKNNEKPVRGLVNGAFAHIMRRLVCIGSVRCHSLPIRGV